MIVKPETIKFQIKPWPIFGCVGLDPFIFDLKLNNELRIIFTKAKGFGKCEP
jgi:hypothetical protein